MIGERTFTEVAPGIFAGPLFSERETEAILAIAERHHWRKARVSSKAGEVVKREVRAAGVQYEKDVPPLGALIRRRVLAATAAFSSRLAPAASTLEGLQLIRYKPGGFYNVHKDNPGGARDNQREISVVVYLNDDFRGGATAFTNLDYAFIPRTGYVLLFPSGYKHKAEAVVEGTKYVIAGWYVSAPVQTELGGDAGMSQAAAAISRSRSSSSGNRA
jgi:predicted 2-oxoglutarate/Fe(II)-dependent dioxygenase YbiX